MARGPGPSIRELVSRLCGVARLGSWDCSSGSREGSLRTKTLLTSTREGDGCTARPHDLRQMYEQPPNPLAGQTCGDRFAGKIGVCSVRVRGCAHGARRESPPAGSSCTATSPGPAAQIHTNLPADSVTVTHWYKQSVYDPADNKIGEIMDVLVDRDGKVTVLIVGVGRFLGLGEKDVAVPFNSVTQNSTS